MVLPLLLKLLLEVAGPLSGCPPVAEALALLPSRPETAEEDVSEPVTAVAAPPPPAAAPPAPPAEPDPIPALQDVDDAELVPMAGADVPALPQVVLEREGGPFVSVTPPPPWPEQPRTKRGAKGRKHPVTAVKTRRGTRKATSTQTALLGPSTPATTPY